MKGAHMKNYGKLTTSEQLELTDFSNREMSIQNLLNRLINEQAEFHIKRNDWFNKIREKYRIPNEDDIYIDAEHWILKDESKEDVE